MKPFLILAIASCAAALSAQESAPASRMAGVIVDEAGVPIADVLCEIFENLAAIEGREAEGSWSIRPRRARADSSGSR